MDYRRAQLRALLRLIGEVGELSVDKRAQHYLDGPRGLLGAEHAALVRDTDFWPAHPGAYDNLHTSDRGGAKNFVQLQNMPAVAAGNHTTASLSWGFFVTGGQLTAFGCALRANHSSWNNQPARCFISYVCF